MGDSQHWSLRPKDDEEMTNEMYYDLQRNHQAVGLIKGCLSHEQYIKVQGRDDAKEVWEILKMAHEGDAKADRKSVV